MVEIIEPHGGKVFDPACGSGGMFVQSAQFIEEHRKELKGSESGVYVYGQEKTLDTVNLAKMNLAVNGLRGEIKQAVGELVLQWAGLAKLKTRYAQYQEKHADETAVDKKNKAQQQLREAFDPFFTALHDGLKHLDKVVRQHEKQQAEQAKAEGKRATTDRKTNALKGALEELHKEVKSAEIFYQHIHWLQERFPKAEYDDVTGLCKLASSGGFAGAGLFAKRRALCRRGDRRRWEDGRRVH